MKLFYSYSHRDEELRNELAKHLSILRRTGLINEWHDRRIGAGREWEGEISEHLQTAEIILLLVSADFLDSDYCYDLELGTAMRLHEARKALVIPIILRPVDWALSPFSKLQGLPTDMRPITIWPNRDEAFANVARAIRDAITARGQRPTVATSQESPSPPLVAPRFRITDIGTLGGRISRASAINDKGHVVGVSSTRDNKPQHAFYHDGTGIYDLGALGPTNSQAHDISGSGIIVGTTTTPTSPQRGGPPYTGFVWKQGCMLDLGTLGGNESTALGVNEAGQVVGQSYRSDGTFGAFMHVHGRMLDLPVLNVEKPYGVAAAINVAGNIVGSAMASDGEYHAVTWEDGQIRDLGTLGGRTSAATSINSAGQIVGRSGTLSGKQRAFLYSAGQMFELGSLGNEESTANAINNAGIVVGRSWVAPGEHHAFVFINGNMLDLNTLVDRLDGFTLTEATGLNDRLDIVGSGYLGGEPRAFKLVLSEESQRYQR